MSKNIRFQKDRTFNSHDGSVYKADQGRIGIRVDVERRMGNVIRDLVRHNDFISLGSLTQRYNRRFTANLKESEILYCLNRLHDLGGIVTMNTRGEWKATKNASDAWSDVDKIQSN